MQNSAQKSQTFPRYNVSYTTLRFALFLIPSTRFRNAPPGQPKFRLSEFGGDCAEINGGWGTSSRMDFRPLEDIPQDFSQVFLSGFYSEERRCGDVYDTKS